MHSWTRRRTSESVMRLGLLYATAMVFSSACIARPRPHRHIVDVSGMKRLTQERLGTADPIAREVSPRRYLPLGTRKCKSSPDNRIHPQLCRARRGRSRPESSTWFGHEKCRKLPLHLSIEHCACIASLYSPPVEASRKVHAAPRICPQRLARKGNPYWP